MNQDTADAAQAVTPQDGTAPAAGQAAAPAGIDPEDVLEALRDVVDPELGINVVDLGLVYGLAIGEDGVATIDMTLTSAA
jgi:metal-sulfur cluster biosynthetic enzyme